jgi:outer membrane protein assembly factor BamB
MLLPIMLVLVAGQSGAVLGDGSQGDRVQPDWPQFRGPGAAGVLDDLPLPASFDEPTWRTPVPGLSHASPVVAGGLVYIATAVVDGEAELKVGLYGAGDSADDLVETDFRLLALDAATGEVRWNVLADRAVPPFGRHTKATQANSTPAVADGAVVALFGSSGLFCFDAATGERRWHVDLGPLDCGPWNATDLNWGFASSPVIADGRVLVQADVKGDAYLAAFELATGKEVWRVRRDDVNGWSTPNVVRDAAGRALVLVNGCKHMGAYNLADGAEVWRMAGGGGIPVPTPVLAGDLVILTGNHRPIEPSHPLKPVFAVRLGARGDLGVPGAADPEGPGGALGEHVAWMATRCGNYMQTPLVYRGHVWLCYDSGVLTCLDLQTGAERFRERVHDTGNGYTASPVAGGGRVLLTSEEGELVLLAAPAEPGQGAEAAKLEVVGRAALGEVCMATPALLRAGEGRSALLFRTKGAVLRFDAR